MPARPRHRYHNASFLYHRGTIELATGHRAEGRAHLTGP